MKRKAVKAIAIALRGGIHCPFRKIAWSNRVVMKRKKQIALLVGCDPNSFRKGDRCSAISN